MANLWLSNLILRSSSLVVLTLTAITQQENSSNNTTTFSQHKFRRKLKHFSVSQFRLDNSQLKGIFEITKSICLNGFERNPIVNE